MKRLLLHSLLLFAALTFPLTIQAQEEDANGPTMSSSSAPTHTLLEKWWNGGSGLNNWFGLSYPLADHGFTVTGEAKEAYFGLLTGGLPNQNKSNWAGEIRLKGLLDFEKLMGIEGLTFESNWRYRQINGQQDTPSTAYASGTVGVASDFNPNHMSSGLGMRILTQFFQWQNEQGKDPRFMIKLGWVNPYQDFLQQPLSKMFNNNMIESKKGIGGVAGPGMTYYNTTTKKYVTYGTSGVPWSSSFATWGGSLRAKPSATTYVQSGLYMAYSGSGGVQDGIYGPTDVYPYKSTSAQYLGTPKFSYQQSLQTTKGNGKPGSPTTGGYVQSANNNHGFNFAGARPFQADTNAVPYSQNGLYNVDEVGWTPKLGADKLEGKYALGGYIWGLSNTDYSSTTWVKGQKKPYAFDQNSLSWGLYLQADQRLCTMHEAAPAAPSNGKDPVATPTYTPSKTRGLYMFNMFSYTPPQNNTLPLYFQTGLVCKGLLDCRKDDAMGIVLGAGFYSSYYNKYIDSQNQALVNDYGSAKNATVPNGPTMASPKQLGTGSSTKQASYYAYAPHFSSTEVVEAFYNIQINKWAALKPSAQWITNPAGNGTVPNDFLLCADVKVAF